MAIDDALLTSGFDDDNQTSYATASITPHQNKLVLLITCGSFSSDPGDPDVSGNGLTWELVESHWRDDFSDKLCIFRAMKTDGAPSAGAITVDWGASGFRSRWIVVEFSGVDVSGTNGSGAIVPGSIKTGEDPNDNSLTITLDAAQDSDNRPFMVVSANLAGGSSITPDTGWSELADVDGAENVVLHAQWRSGAFDTSAVASWSGGVANHGIAFELVEGKIPLSGTLQGVGTLTGGLTQTKGLAGTLQGVGRFIKARLTKVPQGSSGSFVEPDIDFTVFDGYLEGNDGVIHSLIYHEDGEVKGSTAALPTRAEKQDVGSNPNEQRPEFGDFFAQGDFSGGADQLFYHHEGRDPTRFLASEGYNITEEGNLSHLHNVAEALDITNVGAITQAGGVILVADGQDVRVGNGAFPGTWGTENPEAGGTPSTVEDLASRGDEVFAALGAEGVHIRSSAGTWSHFQPDAATDLDVGTATKLAWLKDRLFVVGQAGRDIYEVVADSTPTSIKTLPEGWTFESVFEAGAFIYAPAVNADAGLSRVHILGLNDGATAIEDKGSVQVPRGELIYSGIGYVGQIFLGGGRANDEGGYDPVLYQAVQDDNGFLNLLRVTEGVGGNNDCSVLAFEALGDSIVFSWSQDASALTGERAGIAMYHLGRQAFSQHLKKDAVSSAQVSDILFYEGRIVFAIESDGLYYEDTSTFIDSAYLISSIADWGGASLKIWDRVEVAHHSLVADTSVAVEYTTEDPELDEWLTTIISDTDGDTGKSSRLSNVTSRYFAVRVSSTANAGGTAAPTVHSFSVRSNLTRARPEFNLTRFVRVLAKDRKDGRGSVVYKDPTAERIALMLLLDSWVTVWEPGITWQAFIQGVSDQEPSEPFLSQTNGEPLKEAYLIRLDLVATGEAA